MLIGNIEPLDINSDLEIYLERMDHLFQCNKTAEVDKVNLFVTLIGGEAYKILRDLVSPAKISSKTYDELKEAVRKCMAPKKLIIAETYKFYNCQQQNMTIGALHCQTQELK